MRLWGWRAYCRQYPGTLLRAVDMQVGSQLEIRQVKQYEAVDIVLRQTFGEVHIKSGFGPVRNLAYCPRCVGVCVRWWRRFLRCAIVLCCRVVRYCIGTEVGRSEHELVRFAILGP